MATTTCLGANAIRNIFLSTAHRDTSKYPSASDFVVDIPIIVKQVVAVAVRNYKYTPERLINKNNHQFSFELLRSGNIVTGSIYIDVGDYNHDIDTLLAELNTLLDPYDVQFSINASTQKIEMAFSGSYVTDYFAIPSCKLLKLLGYENGVCLYRTGLAPSPFPSNTMGYDTTAAATNSYKTQNNTDLILRIADIEAVLSPNLVCNRATAIILSSRSDYSMVESQPYYPYPLLQIQHRIQRLRVEILNSDGELYDLGDEEASFMIELHCQPENGCL